MIPILYEKNTTNFNNNGIARLSDCIFCVVTEKESGVYECKFKYPMTGVYYSEIQENRIIYCIHDDTMTPQPFEIYGRTAPHNGVVTFFAHHISYQLGNVVLNPFSSTSCAEAMLDLKSNEVNESNFTYWTDKDAVGDFEITVPTIARSILAGVEGSILDVFNGGDYEWDGYTVKLYEDRGVDNGVNIRYGVNLLKLTQETDGSSAFNAVVPFWYSDGTADEEEPILITVPEKIIRATGTETQELRPTVLDLSDRWDSPPTIEQIRDYCALYFTQYTPWVLDESITVDFIALWQTEDYKNVAPLQRVGLYDYVHIVYEELGINKRMQVVEVVYNVLTEKYDSMELGKAKQSFAQVISAITESEIKKDIPSKSFIQQAIDHNTALITGGLGGNVIFTLNADKKPIEILIMDTDNPSTAVNVWRWNMGGLGFSNHGYEGPFDKIAITQDGQINANMITAGQLNANIVKTGILSDTAGKNYWNMETGEFSLQAVNGSTLDTIAKENTRSILDNANAYGLGWRVNASTFSNTNNGECYYHGFATDGTAADVNGWVLWNGEKVTIPKGCSINPNNTMLFDTTTYSVYRTSDQKFHDVQWNPSTKRWVANDYTGNQPSTRYVWTWDESTDIILASYSLASAEAAIYAAQLFTPPKKYSDLPGQVQETLEQQITDFTTTINAEIADIQEQLDGVVDTYYYSYAPTMSNEPAVEWTTDADKEAHIGDMFFDTSTGKTYRFVTDTVNLITYPFHYSGSRTVNGVTYTANEDGTITANGTATANADYYIKTNTSALHLEQGVYHLSGCPSGGSSSKYRLATTWAVDGTSTWLGIDYGSGVDFTNDMDNNPISVRIRVNNGQTINNLVFTPKLTLKYGWKEIPDTDAQQAMLLASEAKDTADHKRRVFIATPFVPYDQGDIWMQGANGDILVCLEGKTSAEAYDLTDWGKLNKYTDEATALAIAEEQVSMIEIGGRNMLYDMNTPTLDGTAGKGTKNFGNASTLQTNGSGTEWVELPDSPIDEVKYGVRHICTATGGSWHQLSMYSGINSAAYGQYSGRVQFKQGQQYTLSFWAKSDTVGAQVRFAISTNADTNIDPAPSTTIQTIDVANEWKRYIWTFTYVGEDTQEQALYAGFLYNIVATVYCCGYQLEVGNVATDWSEYPQTIISYGGQNLIRNTNTIDLSDASILPNINGYYNDGLHYGLEYETNTAYCETYAVEHGIGSRAVSARRPYFRFGHTGTDGIAKNGLFGLEPGQTYTLSFDGKFKLYNGNTDTTTLFYFSAYIYYAKSGETAFTNGDGKVFAVIFPWIRNQERELRGVFTFTVPEDVVSMYIEIRGNNNTASNFAAGDFLELRNIKLEKGNKATDWSAAPEDIAADITDVYVKSGGRNYLIGTALPWSEALDCISNTASKDTRTIYPTYNLQSLEDLGFTTKDKFTLSFDWQFEFINQIRYPYYHTTRTINGITWTDNGDGTLTANGTVSEGVTESSFIVKPQTTDNTLVLPVGTYRLSGCPSGGSTSTYRIYLGNTEGAIGYDIGDGLEFTVTDATTLHGVYCQIRTAGTTVSNIVFDPKIERIDSFGYIRPFASGKTASSEFANTGWLFDTTEIVPSANEMSGHVEKTFDVTAARLEIASFDMRLANMVGRVTISNLKLEKGDTASAWSAAPEDASIMSNGINVLRGTNIATTLGSGGWADGIWSVAGSGQGERTSIDINDELVKRINRGWEIKPTAYGQGLGANVLIRQTSVPQMEVGKRYTLSCYAKGSGFLSLGAGITAYTDVRFYLDNEEDWKQYVLHFTLPPHTAWITYTTTKRTNVYFGATGADADIQICGMKLEEGIAATEWTPANEDIEDEIVSYAESLGEQIDGKAETWYQTTDPSVNWTTADLKTLHTGDLWYNSTASVQKYYRWSGTAWQEVTSNPPTAVFDEIDGKAQVFTSTPTVPYAKGDLWFNSATSDIMTCITARSTGDYTASDWVKRNKYTDDTAANAAQTAVTNLDNSLNQQGVFNRLTNNGATQGIYLSGGKLYVNASYIGSGTLSANYIKGGTLTLGGGSGSSYGNGSLTVYNSSNSLVARLNSSGLYAIAGTIGGWTIGSSALYNGMTSLNDTSHNGVWVGTDGIALGKGNFKVTNSGALTANNASINGSILSVNGSNKASISGGQILIYNGNTDIGYITNTNGQMSIAARTWLTLATYGSSYGQLSLSTSQTTLGGPKTSNASLSIDSSGNITIGYGNVSIGSAGKTVTIVNGVSINPVYIPAGIGAGGVISSYYTMKFVSGILMNR